MIAHGSSLFKELSYVDLGNLLSMVKYCALRSVLDIADRLKQLLIDSDFTIKPVIGLGYREVS